MYLSNKDLNKQIGWINKKCYLCGRKYPDTILNIEGGNIIENPEVLEK